MPDAAQPAGYSVKWETVQGTGADLQLRSLLDRQQFHDPLGQAQAAGISSAMWPLFGLLWPSGRVLAQHMLSFDIAGKRVLEIGCGLGLASLVLHRRGANVTASDNHPLAEAFLQENIRLNAMLPIKYLCGNWNADNPALGLFDLIIGSDVLYDPGQPQALSSFIGLHSAASVEVIIVDPDRGNISRFNRCMLALGYGHAQTRVSLLPDAQTRYKGRVHSYGRLRENISA